MGACHWGGAWLPRAGQLGSLPPFHVSQSGNSCYCQTSTHPGDGLARRVPWSSLDGHVGLGALGTQRSACVTSSVGCGHEEGQPLPESWQTWRDWPRWKEVPSNGEGTRGP